MQEIFEDNGTVILSSSVIRKTLATKYNFTEGQAAGTIRRATIKKLLSSPLGLALIKILYSSLFKEVAVFLQIESLLPYLLTIQLQYDII